MKSMTVLIAAVIVTIGIAGLTTTSYANACGGMGGGHSSGHDGRHNMDGHGGSNHQSGHDHKQANAEPNQVAKPPIQFDAPPKAGTKATCPVTGDEFVVDDSTLRSTHKNNHVVFCCPGCKSQFDADPEKYLNQHGEQQGGKHRGHH